MNGSTRRAFLAGCGLAAAGIHKVFAAPADPQPEVLEIGPGKRYPSLTAAGERLVQKWDPNATHPSNGPVHLIISPGPPGYYADDFDTYSRRWPNQNHGGWPPWHGILNGPAIIEGEPGKPAPELVCTNGGDGVLYYQKGAFITTDYDATFRRLRFLGFHRRDGYGNYAAVRLDVAEIGARRRGAFLFEDIYVSDCDDGILGGSPGQSVTLRRCEFTRNGGTAGRTHNVYIGPVDLLTVEDVLSTRAVIGHLLKSRAAHTIVRRTRLFCGEDGTASACLDVPDGGILEMQDVICQKGPKSDAGWLIHYSGENQDDSGTPFHEPSSIAIDGLTMIAPPKLTNHPFSGLVGFANQSGDGVASSGRASHPVVPQAQNVSLFGLTKREGGLPNAVVLDEAPRLDWTSPIKS